MKVNRETVQLSLTEEELKAVLYSLKYTMKNGSRHDVTIDNLLKEYNKANPVQYTPAGDAIRGSYDFA